MAIENAYRTLPASEVPAGAYFASSRIAATVSRVEDRSIWWLMDGEWSQVGDSPADRLLVEVKVSESANEVLVLSGWHEAYV